MGLTILAIFIVCAVYVQTRGRVTHVRWARRITDHSNVMAPLNCLFYAFSKIENTPYIAADSFTELNILQQNWRKIRDEALALDRQQQIKSSSANDDLGFNSFFKTGWKRFYIKWYGASLISAETMCPYTFSLVQKIPTVKGAMFAMLPPGARLVKHRDPFAGSLRYHLGLQTPNSDDCFICVDGEKYSWRDGEVVMFDETYLHYAENKSDSNRIVLFLDIKRPTRFFLIDWINTAFSRVVMAASAAKNTDADKVGVLNRLFPAVQKLRGLGKRIKAYNRTLYYILQYGLYLAIIYGLFL